MYKAIVFDLDGTLLDTLGDLANATNAALKEYGYPVRERAEIRNFVGNGAAKLLERASGVRGAACDRLLAYFKVYYGEHCKEETKPYDGIEELLHTLKERGIATAVVSNKPDYAVKLLAKEYFPAYMQAAVGEREADGIRKKPAPDSLFAVMEELGVKKAETLFVGDSEVDIQTAKNAGVDCVSVDWGFKDRAFLEENGATKIISRPSELLRCIL